MRINVLSDPVGPTAFFFWYISDFFDNTFLANETSDSNIPYTPV